MLAQAQAFAWLILGLTGIISFEVFSRYVLGEPHAWVFDATNMIYGTLFMMAGAYTLAKNGHVRGDVLYGYFSPRMQAGMDLVLYVLFFIPGIIALVFAGWDFFQISLAQNEHSSVAADGPPVYPFKAVIPMAGALVLLQGIAEIVRCIVCLKQGQWPSRVEDVEEVDVEKLREMVRVKDKDFAALGAIGADKERTR